MVVVYLKKYFFDIHVSANAVDIGKTIHPHPTLFDPIGMAVEVAHGSCTDLPPGKR
jgi:dihydrolipoamide dehydrogenase